MARQDLRFFNDYLDLDLDQNKEDINRTITPSFNSSVFAQENIPEEQTGIMTQIPFNDYYGPTNIDTSFGVANEPDEEQIRRSLFDRISGGLQSFAGQPGIASIIGAFNPIAGLVSRGIGALSNRLSPGFEDFRNSSTLADFFQARRDRRAREEAAARGLAKQQEIANQTALQAMRSDEAGGGGDRPGGFGSGAGGFSESDPTATEGSF